VIWFGLVCAANLGGDVNMTMTDVLFARQLEVSATDLPSGNKQQPGPSDYVTNVTGSLAAQSALAVGSCGASS
jgi:hypothetical protein